MTIEQKTKYLTLREFREVEMLIPSPGDEVLLNGQVVGIVESTLESGKFPLVRYRDPAGNQHRKLLADIMIRAKKS
jgi:hypothetical protein